AENLVDITVFRAAEIERVEPRGGDQIGWIIGAAMRRSQHQRGRLPVGGQDFERRLAEREGCHIPFHPLTLGAEAGCRKRFVYFLPLTCPRSFFAEVSWPEFSLPKTTKICASSWLARCAVPATRSAITATANL